MVKKAENKLVVAQGDNAQKVFRQHNSELDILEKKAEEARSAVNKKYQQIKKDGWKINVIKSVRKDRDTKKELLQQFEQDKRDARVMLGIPELFDWSDEGANAA